jgi:hypothetical protein
MWPISAVTLEALRYSRTFVSTIDVFQVDRFNTLSRVLDDVPVVSGSVACDRTQNIRRTLTCEIVLEYPNNGYTNLINTSNTRLQVWRGPSFAYGTEKIPIGVFRVDSIDQVNQGSLSISAAGLEAYVAENRFIAPYLPPKGKASAEIASLIEQSVPGSAKILNTCTREYLLAKRTPWAQERWDAIEEIAEALVADVYCRPDGRFIICDSPSLAFSPIQWIVDEGPNGVAVELNRTQSREQVYNAVVASGQSGDAGIPVASAVAYDLNPNSPTYWHGGFGHVPRFYESQFLTTNDQCLAMAENMLGEATALNKTLTFSAIPNPALEPGDAVMVAMLDGTYEKHILQSFAIPLDNSGWEAQTLASKKSQDEGAEAQALGVPMIAQFMSENYVINRDRARLPALGAIHA